MSRPQDKFLSQEDLDLRNLSRRELFAWWDTWLRMAQITNDVDAHTYSHGVFVAEPPALQDTRDSGETPVISGQAD